VPLALAAPVRAPPRGAGASWGAALTPGGPEHPWTGMQGAGVGESLVRPVLVVEPLELA
jgi:hypothetical protein